MRIIVFMILFIFAAIAAIFWMDTGHRTDMSFYPSRIVSLAPGFTESLYALGLGEKVAGVTSFCAWPPQAKDKPVVAGFRDINLEAIARTGADLAVLPDDMVHYRELIENLGVPVLTFDGRTLEGFRRDLQELGRICGAENKAIEIANAFSNKIAAQGSSSDGPGVLFALMNPEECSSPIAELTILGKDGFYNELVRAAGGNNAYKGNLPYPRLSREAILTLNPDVIVAAIPGCPDKEAVQRNWRDLASVNAIANDKLLLLDDAGDTIPGPRSLETFRKLAKVISGKKVEDGQCAP